MFTSQLKIERYQYKIGEWNMNKILGFGKIVLDVIVMDDSENHEKLFLNQLYWEWWRDFYMGNGV